MLKKAISSAKRFYSGERIWEYRISEPSRLLSLISWRLLVNSSDRHIFLVFSASLYAFLFFVNASKMRNVNRVIAQAPMMYSRVLVNS